MALNDDMHGTDTGRDERDPGLSRVYGAARRDEPPAYLDAAILAAARREVGARPRPLASLRAWRVPVSIAAVVVLSVSLVTLVHEEGGDELYRAGRPDVPRPVPPAARVPPPPEDPAKAAAKNTAPAGQGAPRADAPASHPETRDRPASQPLRREQASGSSQAVEPAPEPDAKPFPTAPESVGERPPAGPPPAMDDAARVPAVIMERSAAPAAAPPPADTASGTAAEARRAPPPPAKAASPRAMRSERDIPAREDSEGFAIGGVAGSAPRAAEAPRAPGELSAQKRESAPALQPRVVAMVKELDAQPPEKWLERIQTLRRDGQSAEARELLAEFKRRYPAHPLPPGLQ